MRKLLLFTVTALALTVLGDVRSDTRLLAQADANTVVNPNTYQDLKWRSIGPTRGGRSTAAAGVRTQPNVFYMARPAAACGKPRTTASDMDARVGRTDPTGSIGAIDGRDSNPNIVYAGTGSEAHPLERLLGRGVYKSTDAGKTWTVGRPEDVGQIGQLKIIRGIRTSRTSRPSAAVRRGADRGVFRTKDGGKSWQKVLFIDDQTGAVSIAINWKNPNESVCRSLARAAQAVDDHQRGPGG